MMNNDFIGTKSTIIFFLEKMIGILTGWFLHMFLSRMLGANGYGQFSLIYGIVGIFSAFFTPGVALAVTRFAAISSNPRGTLLSGVRIGLFVDILVYIVYFSSLNLICNVLHVTQLFPFLLVLGLIIMPQGLGSVAAAYLRARLEFGKWFKANLVFHLTRTFFCFVMVLIGMQLWGVVFGFLIAEIAFFVATIILVKVSHKETLESFKKILQSSFPFWLTGISALIFQRIDIFCIQYFLNDYNQVGYYAAAFRLAEILLILLTGISFYLLPVLSYLFTEGKSQEIYIVLERTVRYSFLCGMFLCIWLASNSTVIMSFVFSHMLVKGAGVLTILCYGWMIIFVPYILNVAILAKGQYWTFFVICLLGNIFDLILNVIFVPLLGIEGAAYTTVFSYILVNMASLLYLYNRKILPIQKKLFIPSTTFVKVILASLALVMFSKLSPFVETWYFFGVKSFVAFLLYSGILFILREFNQEDKKIIQFLKSSVMQKISFRGL